MGLPAYRSATGSHSRMPAQGHLADHEVAADEAVEPDAASALPGRPEGNVPVTWRFPG